MPLPAGRETRTPQGREDTTALSWGYARMALEWQLAIVRGYISKLFELCSKQRP